MSWRVLLALKKKGGQVHRKILVAFDGSDSAREALREAVDLAQAFVAELYCISVEGRLPAYAATLGEVDVAKAEKDRFFAAVEHEAVNMARERGFELHPVKVTDEPATASCTTPRRAASTSSCSARRATRAPTVSCWAIPPTRSSTTLPVRP